MKIMDFFNEEIDLIWMIFSGKLIHFSYKKEAKINENAKNTAFN